MLFRSKEAIDERFQVRRADQVYHFDCYRLNTLRDALNIGIEEYFASGNICFIEWAENIEELLPVDTVRVNIVVEDDGSREVSVCK